MDENIDQPKDRAGQIALCKRRLNEAIEKSGDRLRQPRWNYWRQIEEVNLSEAIALAFGLEPSIVFSNESDGFLYLGLSYLTHKHDNPLIGLLWHLDNRGADYFEIAKSHLKTGNITPRDSRPHAKSIVNLPSFAKWAASRWDIPPDLASVGGVKSPIEKENMSTTERQTVRKIIAGFLAQGFRPEEILKPYGIAKDIQSALDSSGISLSDDTIVKWINEAAPLLDLQKKSNKSKK